MFVIIKNSSEIISECIAQTQKHGSGIVCVPCQEAMLETDDYTTSHCAYPRDQLNRTQTPQGFKLGIIYNAHLKAQQMWIQNSIASCTLMVEIGEKVYFSTGSEKNIKLTTPDDIDIFKALLQIRRQENK